MVSWDQRFPEIKTLTIRVLKKDLSINTARSNQSRVQGLNLISSHENLDISAVIEAIKLIEEFQHSPLDFSFATRCRIVSLGTDGIDFVNEYNRRGMFRGNLENLANQTGAITEVFLDQLTTHNAKESSAGLVGNCFRK